MCSPEARCCGLNRGLSQLQMVDSSSATVDMETDEGAKMLAMYGNLEVSAAPHFAVADAPHSVSEVVPRTI